MKAIVVSQYGGPEVLEYKDSSDPSPGPDEVLVRVAAASINPFDLKRRSGVLKAFAPIEFPGILGVDIAGTVVSCGRNVKGLSTGDRVFGMADHTYAELCVAAGLDLVEAAAIPMATTTGYQLIMKGALIRPGQSILVTGAVGSVGRTAVFTAKSLGAKVFAGVRKSQLEQAAALDVDGVIALDDTKAMANLQALDAVADTVGGDVAELLIGKVKVGGIFASVIGQLPENSAVYAAKGVLVFVQTDVKVLLQMAKAVVEGKLKIPMAAKIALKDARSGHELVAKGAKGKVLLVP
jgi:NADPH:quinone reductase-like Zn-dependent oxidoreductase